MKNIFFLGTSTFIIPFVSSLAVTLNLTASAFIGGLIAATATITIVWFLSKKYERAFKKLDRYADSLKNVESQISRLKKQNKEFANEIEILKEEKESLKTQVEELQKSVGNLENKEKKIIPKTQEETKEQPIKKTGLYDYILEGLKNSRDFYNPQDRETFKSYLQSLQKPAKELWESYRSSQVKVNYSEPSVQAAYLIRYYPHYVEMTFEILKQCSKDFVFEEKINACFFGAGPCPEVTGLAQFLTEYCPQTKELFVNVYDIASEQWALSRTVTRDLIPHIWKGKLSGSGRLPNFDFSLPNCFESITEVISNSHLFVFQNCFNEIENSSDIKDNIKFLLARAPLNSFVVIGDLFYKQNRHIIEDIAEFAQTTKGYKIIGRDELEIRSSLKIPQIVKENLLVGKTPPSKLIPRSRIKFMFLVIRKS